MRDRKYLLFSISLNIRVYICIGRGGGGAVLGVRACIFVYRKSNLIDAFIQYDNLTKIE